MTNAKGNNLTYAGVNWPGHGDAMIPEGLQYASVSDIVAKIKSIGMNTIRLTWAVQMVDDILDHGVDVEINEIRTSLNTVLGVENGTTVFEAVMTNNPSFTPNITRLQVFDAIAAECAKQQIYVHLDNHVSKAGWCCTEDDGNGWFDEKHFDVEKWRRALSFMAAHVSSDAGYESPKSRTWSINARLQGKGESWPTLVSMGLRNELRKSKSWFDGGLWPEWYDNMTAAADAVHKVNPELLIFFSGTDYDTYLNPIFTGKPMGGNRVFNKDELAYANKIVLEVHDYDADSTNCTQKQRDLTKDSFGALDRSTPGTKSEFPLVMSEWGFNQTSNQYTEPYATCLREILPEQRLRAMKPSFTPSQISYSDFTESVEDYPQHVPEKIQPLEPLRYLEIPEAVAQRKTAGEAFLEKTELQSLVEWKLYSVQPPPRPPFLPKKAINAQHVQRSPLTNLQENSAPSAPVSPNSSPRILPLSKAITTLCTLKGVGPATASLILSCYDPTTVPFFSDELFRWLHWEDTDTQSNNGSKKRRKNGGDGQGWERKIKYTAKEYFSVFEKTTALRERLSEESGKNFRAVDVERAALGIKRRDGLGLLESVVEEGCETAGGDDDDDDDDDGKNVSPAEGDSAKRDPAGQRESRSKRRKVG
ncbi:MAG: hypothetical protein Q9188_000360 [Gyalolechia gomerana]